MGYAVVVCVLQGMADLQDNVYQLGEIVAFTVIENLAQGVTMH